MSLNKRTLPHVFALLCPFLLLISCAHDQQLVSITIQPAVETFGDTNTPVAANAGSTVQLRALGHYIHPVVMKDITTQVTWASNTPDIANVDPNGALIAAGIACGNALVSATVRTDHSIGGRDSSGAIVTGYMTANVVCPTAGPTLTVSFAGAGSGTITSSPAGLSCTASCTTSFSSGTTVTLTASPNGSFGGWTGCDSVGGSGLMCTVNNLSADRTVIATFN